MLVVTTSIEYFDLQQERGWFRVSMNPVLAIIVLSAIFLANTGSSIPTHGVDNLKPNKMTAQQPENEIPVEIHDETNEKELNSNLKGDQKIPQKDQENRESTNNSHAFENLGKNVDRNQKKHKKDKARTKTTSSTPTTEPNLPYRPGDSSEDFSSALKIRTTSSFSFPYCWS